MEKLTVTFLNNLPFENYLANSFVSRNVAVAVAHRNESGAEKATITVECGREIFDDVLAEALTVEYKLRKIKQSVDGNGVAFAAFCGILVGQDFTEEKNAVKGKLPVSSDLNADGIFNFLLAENDYVWRALATLGGKLYAQCKEKEDVYALIKYFLGGETLMPRTLVIDNGIYFDDDNTDMPCYDAFDDTSENAAFNVMLKKPCEVIVPSPSKYSPELIGLIKKLGE